MKYLQLPDISQGTSHLTGRAIIGPNSSAQFDFMLPALPACDFHPSKTAAAHHN